MSEIPSNRPKKQLFQMPQYSNQIQEGDRVTLTQNIQHADGLLRKGSAGDVLEISKDLRGNPDGFYITFKKYPEGLLVHPSYVKYMRGPRVLL